MVNEKACSYLPESSKYYKEICLTDDSIFDGVKTSHIVIGVLALLLVATMVIFMFLWHKKVLCCRKDNKKTKVSSPGKFLCHFYTLLCNKILLFLDDIEMKNITSEESQAMLSRKKQVYRKHTLLEEGPCFKFCLCIIFK